MEITREILNQELQPIRNEIGAVQIEIGGLEKEMKELKNWVVGMSFTVITIVIVSVGTFANMIISAID